MIQIFSPMPNYKKIILNTNTTPVGYTIAMHVIHVCIYACLYRIDYQNHKIIIYLSYCFKYFRRAFGRIRVLEYLSCKMLDWHSTSYQYQNNLLILCDECKQSFISWFQLLCDVLSICHTVSVCEKITLCS